MHLTLSKTYPKTIPRIEIEDVVGLSEKEVAELKNDLNIVANNNIGEVMGHELATATENYLECHNRKPQSLYDVGLKRQKQEDAALNDLRQGTVLKVNETNSKSVDNAKNVHLSSSSEVTRISSNDTTTCASVSSISDNSTPLTLSSSPRDTSNVEHWFSTYRNDKPNDPSSMVGSVVNVNDVDDDDDDFSLDSDNNSDTKNIELDDPDSRYCKEFKEVCLLGKGAGGEVWKVVNRLDEREYAVKKILLDSKDEMFNNKILREVQTISRLLHKNIVRYYAAWIEEKVIVSSNRDINAMPNSAIDAMHDSETGTALSEPRLTVNTTTVKDIVMLNDNDYFNMNNGIIDSESSGDDHDDSTLSSSSCEMSSDDADRESDNESSSGSDYQPRKAQPNQSNTNKSKALRKNSLSSSSASHGLSSSSFSHSETNSSNDSDSGEDYIPSSKVKSARATSNAHEDWGEFEDLDRGASYDSYHSPERVAASILTPTKEDNNIGGGAYKTCIRKLYIQMEYCKATLRETIDNGQLWQNENQITRLFRQMVEGIEYIHKEGVIHRDLKVHYIVTLLTST